MMIFDQLEHHGAKRLLALADSNSGLRAFIALDDMTLGPAFGGTRTRSYSSEEEAIGEVVGLAESMTLKCAAAGLNAGGGKAVLLDHEDMNRVEAFRAFGRFVEELGGIFRTSGDLGTSEADLLEMSSTTRFVHTAERRLGQATARGVAAAVEACADIHGLDSLSDVHIAIQGCGAIGASVARALHVLGAHLSIADLDGSKAAALSREVGGTVLAPNEILTTHCDILVPCATGGAVDEHVAKETTAWAICPGANRAVATPIAETTLFERGVLVVPDFISSAGAVIVGVAEMSTPRFDPSPSLEAIRARTRSVLEEAKRTHTIPSIIARQIAQGRIEEQRLRIQHRTRAAGRE